MAIAAANGNHRRSKAAFFLFCCGWAAAAPHWLDDGRNIWPAIILAVLLGGYALGVVLVEGEDCDQNSKLISYDQIDEGKLPSIDVLVAALDEENVVERLIDMLSSISYPEKKISFWIIDDGSQDKTFELLENLIRKYSNFNLLKRSKSAGGGKSGALNYALKYSKADWLFILDADAQLQEDVLLRIIHSIQKVGWSAVQLRKAVVNSNYNFLTSFQSMEMAMDAFIQRGRLHCGGVVELRGNGQFINRKALEECGGFNEATVTDDLDLTFRLLISGFSTGILWDPPVEEEAVETFQQLFKQRQRWAEGGLQRFFDYWPSLISQNLDLIKRRDLACFFLLQYAIPIISFLDCIISLLTRTYPVYWPLSLVALSVSGLAYLQGCSKQSEGPLIPYPTPIKLILAITYLLHWFIVIPWVTLKMAIFPKKLVWAKTIHKGN